MDVLGIVAALLGLGRAGDQARRDRLRAPDDLCSGQIRLWRSDARHRPFLGNRFSHFHDLSSY